MLCPYLRRTSETKFKSFMIEGLLATTNQLLHILWSHVFSRVKLFEQSDLIVSPRLSFHTFDLAE